MGEATLAARTSFGRPKSTSFTYPLLVIRVLAGSVPGCFEHPDIAGDLRLEAEYAVAMLVTEKQRA
jgi:hypothetical protein